MKKHDCQNCGAKSALVQVMGFWTCEACGVVTSDPAKSPVQPAKPDLKVLQDYDSDGWRLVQYPDEQQWWEHKNPTIEPEENPEPVSDYDEFGWRTMRSRVTSETFQQHRDYELPIRPYTLKQAIAFWKEKVSDEGSAELLKYLCDPFGRDTLTYKQAWETLSKDEKRTIKQRISGPDPPIASPPIPALSDGFNFPYTCGEINRRLRELGVDRSSDRVITYAKANGLPIKGDKVSFMEATDQQLLDLLETVKVWEKEVVKL